MQDYTLLSALMAAAIVLTIIYLFTDEPIMLDPQEWSCVEQVNDECVVYKRR
jgi:hypothetical protein